MTKLIAVLATLSFIPLAHADQAAPAAKPAPAKPTPAPAAAPAAKPAMPAAKAEAVAPTPPAPPPMAAPTPAPELLEMAKSMKGTWKCSGEMMDRATMSMQPTTATVTWKLDLDSFWLVGNLTMGKTKASPKAGKVVFYRTFSAGKWTQIGMDNDGMWGMHSGGAAVNGVVTMEGERNMGGMKVSTRDKEEMKGPKEIQVSGEAKGPDGKWMPTYNITCKK